MTTYIFGILLNYFAVKDRSPYFFGSDQLVRRIHLFDSVRQIQNSPASDGPNLFYEWFSSNSTVGHGCILAQGFGRRQI